MIKSYKEAVVTTRVSPTVLETTTTAGTVAAGEDDFVLVV